MKFFLLLIAIALLFGCASNQSTYTYKGVAVAKDAVPGKCIGLTDCDMLACTVSSCWCQQMLPEGGNVYKSSLKATDETSAISIAKEYLAKKSIKYDSSSLRAAKLNALFYSVFYNDAKGNEEVLTVAVDGTVMKTACGA